MYDYFLYDRDGDLQEITIFGIQRTMLFYSDDKLLMIISHYIIIVVLHNVMPTHATAILRVH